MSQENSGAIHLRKGDDYMQSELMGKGLCTVDYYMKAISQYEAVLEIGYHDAGLFCAFISN